MAATETKKKSPLSMTIGSRGKYPTKRSINLYYKENKTRKILLELASFAVFLVALYFFTVYAVIAKLRQADEARRPMLSTRRYALSIHTMATAISMMKRRRCRIVSRC